MNYQEWKESFVDGDGKSDFDVYGQSSTNHWTRDKIKHMKDITQEWTKTKGIVSELQEYIIKGIVYKVD